MLSMAGMTSETIYALSSGAGRAGGHAEDDKQDLAQRMADRRRSTEPA